LRCAAERRVVSRVNEIARCLEIPLNIALANSAKPNYASGRRYWSMYATTRVW